MVSTTSEYLPHTAHFMFTKVLHVAVTEMLLRLALYTQYLLPAEFTIMKLPFLVRARKGAPLLSYLLPLSLIPIIVFRHISIGYVLVRIWHLCRLSLYIS